MHYVHKKARCGPEIATFRTKTLCFLRVIRLNWLGKIELRGTRSSWFLILLLVIRGGVEDTRLEAKAKAKDTKKIRGQGQGQGQPFRGQTLSRPRTGMLEAKAKDQGHKAQVLSKKKKKKKSSQKFFRRSPKKKKKKRSSQKFFKRSPPKNVFQTIFQALHKILTFQKIMLSSSRGQANFRGLEASRPRPRPRT